MPHCQLFLLRLWQKQLKIVFQKTFLAVFPIPVAEPACGNYTSHTSADIGDVLVQAECDRRQYEERYGHYRHKHSRYQRDIEKFMLFY